MHDACDAQTRTAPVCRTQMRMQVKQPPAAAPTTPPDLLLVVAFATADEQPSAGPPRVQRRPPPPSPGRETTRGRHELPRPARAARAHVQGPGGGARWNPSCRRPGRRIHVRVAGRAPPARKARFTGTRHRLPATAQAICLCWQGTRPTAARAAAPDTGSSQQKGCRRRRRRRPRTRRPCQARVPCGFGEGEGERGRARRRRHAPAPHPLLKQPAPCSRGAGAPPVPPGLPCPALRRPCPARPRHPQPAATLLVHRAPRRRAGVRAPVPGHGYCAPRSSRARRAKRRGFEPHTACTRYSQPWRGAALRTASASPLQWPRRLGQGS